MERFREYLDKELNFITPTMGMGENVMHPIMAWKCSFKIYIDTGI